MGLANALRYWHPNGLSDVLLLGIGVLYRRGLA
jgi:hypothetical protein